MAFKSNLHTLFERTVEDYNKWDVDSIMSARAGHCIHYFLPGSLLVAPMKNDHYAGYIKGLVEAFTDFRMVVHDYIIDSSKRIICFWAMVTARTKAGNFRNELMYWIKATADGT